MVIYELFSPDYLSPGRQCSLVLKPEQTDDTVRDTDDTVRDTDDTVNDDTDSTLYSTFGNYS